MFLAKSSKRLLQLENIALKPEYFSADGVGCMNSIIAGVHLQSLI
jgi:hypothetical protein